MPGPTSVCSQMNSDGAYQPETRRDIPGGGANSIPHSEAVGDRGTAIHELCAKNCEMTK